MRILYGDDACVIAADDYAEWQQNNPDVRPNAVVPWGWDMRLKYALLRQGMDADLLPDDEYIERLRRLQHRTTIMPMQTHSACANSVAEVRELLDQYGEIVLKAPWSGSGRGVRWVSQTLSPLDESWIEKIVLGQRCVMVEQRQTVAHDFALEFNVEGGEVEMTGLSLFSTQSGVYRHNSLMSDDAIRSLVGLQASTEAAITRWLSVFVAPYYNGCLGVDFFVSDKGDFYVSEMNLRHTMGMVAHRFLELHPEREGTLWIPNLM